MAVKVSTGLRNSMLVGDSFKGLMDGGTIRIFAAATLPDTADEAETGTLLVEITVDGDGTTGLNFAAAADGGILLKANEVWKGTIASTGTATYYRHVADSDGGAYSTTDCRLQGTVDVVGADLNLSSVNLQASGEQSIDYYSVILPTF